jgi:hypothetical protein
MNQTLTRQVIGFCHRLTYATLIGGATWLFAWLPSDLGASASFRLACQALNLPVAFVSLYLPPSWQGLDIVLGRILPHSLGTAGFLWQHLRTAVPTYVLIFYLPNLIVWLRRRSRSRALRTATHPSGGTG